MKPSTRFFALLSCGTLFQACRLDMQPAGPNTHRSVAADVMADGPEWEPWSTPINLGSLVNSPLDDNRPAISKDGLSLYITSGRLGGFGGLDIWVSHRASLDDPWGPPQNLGPRVNSSSNDVAPTFSPDGHRMYFHSFRPGGCGLADIYVSRRRDTRDDFGWGPPEDLGCVVNTPYVNAGPTIFEDETTGITTLYFTVQNNPPGSDQGFDIYASARIGDEGAFGPPVLVQELSSPFRDTRTAIRRDGLEIFLSSGRPGGVGNEDLWVSTRASTLDPWSTPVNLGAGGEHHRVRWGPRAVVRWYDTLLPLEPAWRCRGERPVCDDTCAASRAGRGRGCGGGEGAAAKDSHDRQDSQERIVAVS